MSGNQTTGHQHAEAYCVMTYASDDQATTVRVWNSRDGVTPFGIGYPIDALPGQATSLKHINWRQDVRDPHHTPQPGELVFVDPDEEHLLAEMLEVMRWRVEQVPDYAPPPGPEREDYIRQLALTSAKEAVELGHPMLITAEQWHQATSQE